MREINVLDLLPDIVQHRATLERDHPQKRRQKRKIVRRQRRQELVESSVLELPGKRGRAMRHQYTSINVGRKAGHEVAHVMAVSKVSAIPTVASLANFGMCVPFCLPDFMGDKIRGSVIYFTLRSRAQAAVEVAPRVR